MPAAKGQCPSPGEVGAGILFCQLMVRRKNHNAVESRCLYIAATLPHRRRTTLRHRPAGSPLSGNKTRAFDVDLLTTRLRRHGNAGDQKKKKRTVPMSAAAAVSAQPDPIET